VRIALVSEGTYPYAMGGVSVWCEQLITGMSDFRWEVVALTVDGTERAVFELPENLDQVHSIPLWGPWPSGHGLPAARSRAGKPFLEAYEAFVSSLIAPPQSDPDRAAVDRSRFLLALRGMYEYAADGGDLPAGLMSNQALTMMMEVWRELRVDDPGQNPTLADAVDAAWLIEHMLRPLSAPPVRADIVHSSMNGLSTLVGFAAKWRYGTPLVMSEHGIYLRERYISYLNSDSPHAVKVLVLSFFRSLAGAAYLFTDALTPHSSYNRRWMLQNGADPERMWTMYNGVEPDDFPAAAQEPDQPTVSFMGRVDPLKDLHTLIRAFALVHQRLPQAKLRIFGGVPAVNQGYAASCQRLIEELGLAEVATMEGRVRDAVDAYHAGSIVALTSISEGFPYTVIEAMACGRTVVCTDVGGVAEAVGEAGIVVQPRDVPAIADACLQLLCDHPRRQRLGVQARERVLERFTLSQSIEAYRVVYEQLARPQSDSTAKPRHLRTSARGRAAVIPGQRKPAPQITGARS
jgi:polysaccharide biosynthesis protein PelF